VKGKYLQPITSTAPNITTTTEIDLTITWSSKKSYIIMLLPSKSARFMCLVINIQRRSHIIALAVILTLTID
jgi:hypothetical protein